MKNRPGITSVLQYLGNSWGISIAFLLFGYFLAKIINLKWWSIISVLLGLELFYFVMIHIGPSFLPESFKTTRFSGHMRGVAIGKRPMIQFEEDCSQYSSKKFYTLKPGKSHFKSFEFDNEYDVNSMGFRDTEENLNNPKVLFMGDSFTMGWGVAQDSTFTKQFGRISGLKTLNSGISSYGTAREYLNFKDIKKDSLKLVVIQFHDTDLEENSQMVKNKKLDIRPESEYQIQVNANSEFKPYYLFKNLKAAILDLIAPKPIFKNDGPKLDGAYLKFPDYQREFFEIIKLMRNDFSGPIIITYIGNYVTDPKVLASFEAYAKANNITEVYFVPLSDKIDSAKHYYFYDDHINAAGHKVVANELYVKWQEIKALK